MKITLEVINGTPQEIEDKTIELENETGESYCFMKYNDFAEIIEERAKYINSVRAWLETKADDDKAYKQGWDDCKKAMSLSLFGI